MIQKNVMTILGCLTAALALDVAVVAQQGTTTGWMMYSDTVGRSLELTPEQEERIRDWHGRYQQDYDRLGHDGVQHRDFGPLHQRRNNELRGILTPDQYTRWNEMDTNRDRRSTNTTGGAPGPEMRPVAPAQPGVNPDSRGANTGRDRGPGVQQPAGTGTNIDRGLGTDGGTGTTGTGSATDGGNRNLVNPPTP